MVLVDAGRDHGVTVGSAVWWPPGVYLGEVIDVREDSALVELLSSAGVRHQVRLGGGLTVDMIGRGGGSLVAEVPETAEVATGTIAVSDQFAVPVGRVATSQAAETLAQERLYIRPLVSLSAIEYVYVQNTRQ